MNCRGWAVRRGRGAVLFIPSRRGQLISPSPSGVVRRTTHDAIAGVVRAASFVRSDRNAPHRCPPPACVFCALSARSALSAAEASGEGKRTHETTCGTRDEGANRTELDGQAAWSSANHSDMKTHDSGLCPGRHQTKDSISPHAVHLLVPDSGLPTAATQSPPVF